VANDLASSAGFLGVGWAFPITVTAEGGFKLVSAEDSIEDCVTTILGTSLGERVMRPEFGCGIWELFMEANTTQLHGRVQQRVADALTKWEPRIDVLDVRVDSPAEQKNLLLIRIDYRIRSNNAAYNLVYPFFLQEGVAG
jgi:uncharacterized protein